MALLVCLLAVAGEAQERPRHVKVYSSEEILFVEVLPFLKGISAQDPSYPGKLTLLKQVLPLSGQREAQDILDSKLLEGLQSGNHGCQVAALRHLEFTSPELVDWPRVNQLFNTGNLEMKAAVLSFSRKTSDGRGLALLKEALLSAENPVKLVACRLLLTHPSLEVEAARRTLITLSKAPGSVGVDARNVQRIYFPDDRR